MIYNDIKAGRIAQCQRCLGESKSQNIFGTTGGLKRRRSSDGSGGGSKAKSRKKSRKEWEDSSSEDEDQEVPVAGTMKPDITFFGEDLPADFHNRLVKHDREIVDLVIVIGTSLKVAPVSEVVGIIPSEVPQIYISREVSCRSCRLSPTIQVLLTTATPLRLHRSPTLSWLGLC